jgi:hypothetical protein
LYKEIVDPNKTWENITQEEHDGMLKSKRSNNQLDTSLLQTLYPGVPNVREAIIQSLHDIKKRI